MNEFAIYPSRACCAGLSGGARTSSALVLLQSDLFKGDILDCGAQFYKRVPHVESTNWSDPGGEYGVSVFDADDVSRAKANGKFFIITGPGDFVMATWWVFTQAVFTPMVSNAS